MAIADIVPTLSSSSLSDSTDSSVPSGSPIVTSPTPSSSSLPDSTDSSVPSGSRIVDIPTLNGSSLPDGDTGAWRDFVSEANTFLQWILSTVFLFVPAKLISLAVKVYQEPSTSTIHEFLEKLQKSYFPLFFLPPVLLYAAFYLSSKSFRNKQLKFWFEVLGLGMGAVATGILLFYLSDDGTGWWFPAGALAVFFVVFLIVKTSDYFCS